MKQYYLSKDQISKEGPFSIKQLETKLIDKETLVWYEGLKEWKKVSEIKDLNYIIKKSPFRFEKKSKPKPTAPLKEPEPTTGRDPVNSFLPVKHKMFRDIFSKKGRIGRLEYFITYLGWYFIWGIYTNKVTETDSTVLILALFILFLIATYVVIVQGAKRCHDRGNSGFYQLIPFYTLFMLFGKGDDSSNKYDSEI
tara:strand:+ start:1985 stop:2572 length:588 start_codon:yes stop_codon:yes gene_type:complete